LSEYHKQLITNTYEISSDKIVVIGYGLSPQFQSNIYKIKKRFIWTSDPVRNLDFLLKIFPKIRSEFADAELHIFRDNLSEDQKHIVENHSQFIKHRGFLTNDKIQEEFQKSDVWLYCTDFTETFCLSALEAMRAGCLCIVSEIGNLPDIVAERGIILSKLEEEEIIKILRIHFDIDLFKNLIKKGQSWAELHTWEKIGKVWLELIGNDAFIL
jgi:glycosyltransferase involved in cell wall biosynthesis